jgi:putative endonuclease
MAGRKSNTETGRRGELLARQFLEQNRYTIVEQNWRCSEGEIDLVARQGNDWVFVEVKARRGDAFGIPEDSITLTKARKLINCGLMYIAEHGLDDASWRIDVVAIDLGGSDAAKRIRLHKNAVIADDSF